MNLGSGLSHGWRRVPFAGLCAAALLAPLTSCAPAITAIPGRPDGPTVVTLEKHLTCQLAYAVVYAEASDESSIWRHLIDEDYVPSFQLTLLVTDSEGLNPSFNFITPLESFGEVAPIVKSMPDTMPGKPYSTAAVMGATSDTYNQTLAVGFQLDGLQDRNITVNYQVDLGVLRHAIDALHAYPQKLTKYQKAQNDYQNELKEYNEKLILTQPQKPIMPVFTDADEVLKNCGLPGLDNAPTVAPTDVRSIAYGLEGDVGLGATMFQGLTAFDDADFGPQSAGGQAGGQQQGQTGAIASGTSPNTNFSSKVDFSILWGVNGGPSWSLLKFKGPSGGSGGGGGASGEGSGGSSGSGGGSGGGGGQLLNFSRTKLDTLTVTFATTCRFYPRLPVPEQQAPLGSDLDLKETMTFDDVAFGPSETPDGSLPAYTANLLVKLPSVPLKPGAFVFDPNGLIIVEPVTGGSPGIGKISWAGATYTPQPANLTSPESINLVGTVTDIRTNNPVGQITLEGGITDNGTVLGGAKIDLHDIAWKLIESSQPVTPPAEDTLPDPVDAKKYWASLPQCPDNSSAAAQAAGASGQLENNILDIQSAVPNLTQLLQ